MLQSCEATQAEIQKIFHLLFMYSQGDDLVAAHAVESVAGAMEAQGDSVALCEFQASPHVAHLRTHRKQYLTAIDDFFRNLDTLTASQ
ncbi:Transmembrane protein 53 [Hondaea fermentalgiana]|uniref:Transmembrane protein 53 n=1 Tax=Hondaea fermentalgiana TaxID=2315210 RepID=A0A2R5GLI7_9STRA|nr:Transmembrane protein 53 [Hondaea fermentalgiana]|eukprot:GBG31740.1 Transmembrane protein 53 [Hondaea fermentalgiana]